MDNRAADDYMIETAEARGVEKDIEKTAISMLK